ncbi:MAG: hypothetical protein ACJAR3_001817, partial [Roseivirga sp.]
MRPVFKNLRTEPKTQLKIEGIDWLTAEGI